VPLRIAEHGLKTRRRHNAKVGVNDGAKLIGCLQLRDDRTGRVGRHSEHDGVVRSDRDDAALAEIEPGDGVRRNDASAQLMAEAEGAPMVFQVRHRRLDEKPR